MATEDKGKEKPKEQETKPVERPRIQPSNEWIIKGQKDIKEKRDREDKGD